MNAATLEDYLATHRLRRLSANEWERVADAFPEVERHDTMMAGPLLIVRTAHGLAAVERPTRGERAVRLLGDATAARQFIDHRMAQYERMWDGCGCRVDYYAPVDR